MKNNCNLEDAPLVSISCLVYNHEPYLRDCFEGFIKQKTSFPIEILVHDDASTDHSADIIREYTEKYPDLFKPIYQTENQYSKGVKISFEYQYPRAHGKYIALCEGDDYWTDPNKLQMQVDWLEEHEDYVMVCSDAIIEAPKKKLKWSCYRKDTTISVKDMVLGGGSFVQTCTIVFRKKLLDNYPQYCINCHIGDYPLQIWAILNGKVRYFSKKYGFYRFNHPASWTSSQIDYKKHIPGWRSEITMLQGLNQHSSFKFNKVFTKKQTQFILEKAIFSATGVRDKQSIQLFLSSFPDIKKDFSFIQKIDLFFAFKLPSKLYQICRAILSILCTLLWPTQQRIRRLSIKIQDAL